MLVIPAALEAEREDHLSPGVQDYSGPPIKIHNSTALVNVSTIWNRNTVVVHKELGPIMDRVYDSGFTRVSES